MDDLISAVCVCFMRGVSSGIFAGLFIWVVAVAVRVFKAVMEGIGVFSGGGGVYDDGD